MRAFISLGWAVLVAAGGPLVAQPPEPPKRESAIRRLNVKTRTDFQFADDVRVSGTVEKVAAGVLTLRCPRRTDSADEVSRDLYAVDQLADGTISGHAGSGYAYALSDLKVGDRVWVYVLHDSGDGRDYFHCISIDRRPGAKLPRSQKPKEDERHRRDSLLNDIDNGVDVSDEDIAAEFPPTLEPGTGKVRHPGGLTCEYTARLHAARQELAAKSQQELKAAPPEKK